MPARSAQAPPAARCNSFPGHRRLPTQIGPSCLPVPPRGPEPSAHVRVPGCFRSCGAAWPLHNARM
eukprot:5304046-Alexandrium_andersonii.AAC.1